MTPSFMLALVILAIVLLLAGALGHGQAWAPWSTWGAVLVLCIYALAQQLK